MTPANDEHLPAHVGFAPDEMVVDEAGWLWWEDEWHLVTMYEDGDKTFIVFIAPGDQPGDFDWQDAELYAGCPYMPACRPAIHPGHCDLLEVRVSMARGFSTSCAIGKPDHAKAMQNAVMNLISSPKGALNDPTR